MLIEKGAAWPDHVLPSRVHLLLTCLLYRLWEKVRLRHLRPWTALRRLPEMFGGLDNVGADDAWFSTAIDMEYSVLHNLALVGRC